MRMDLLTATGCDLAKTWCKSQFPFFRSAHRRFIGQQSAKSDKVTFKLEHRIVAIPEQKRGAGNKTSLISTEYTFRCSRS
jgi:hypothetical protein